VKGALLRLLTAPGLRWTFEPLMRDRATVFSLHRFADAERGTPGHDPDALRALLALLRRERCSLLRLDTVIERLASGEPLPRRTVCFTIDDGYADQASIGAPLFAEFDCPALLFVTTGFLDRELWLWWDRVEYILDHARVSRAEVDLNDRTYAFEWPTSRARASALSAFTELCKTVEDGQKEAAIRALAHVAEVDVPHVAPARYEPMSWEDVRACERAGIGIGPHSVAHPVLARVTADRATREIERSWSRVQAEAASPVPVFSYPNGQSGDFGQRELALLQRLGFTGAVAGHPGHVTRQSAESGESTALLNLPRYSLPGTLPEALQCVTGLERAKDLSRHMVRRRS
jgi:peptidoglycan/xylan/chitin deacetylase (PgdA/CDA1 family)